MADLPAHVPLLADVLAVCEGMVVNVEIKNAPQDPGWDPGEAVAALTAAAIDEAGLDRPGHRVVVPVPPRCWPSRRPTARLALGALWGFATDPGPALAEAAEAGFRAVHPFVTSVDPRAGASAPTRRASPSTCGR